MRHFLIPLIIFICYVFHSCRDDDFNTSSSIVLTFSADTITFDTIFTTIGSTTKQLKIYNPSKDPIRISRIYLAGLQNSFFKMNVDGDITQDISDIEIRPKDSLYIFIQVTIDPFGVNNPMVTNDSIIFITNGNVQDVNLIAFGQDVHLIDGEWIKTTTWIPDKPYLIYNSMGIDSISTLTIEPGVILYFHKNSYLYVLGTLIAEGTREDPIHFRGDRLDQVLPGLPYDRIPDQWGGIIIYPTSTGNKFNYCIIRNGMFGILAAGDLNNRYQAELSIKNSILQNFAYAALLMYNARLDMLNCLIANAKDHLLAIPSGGEYSVYHCTFSNYLDISNISHASSPSVLISNQFYTTSSFTGEDTLVTGDLVKARFVNCIIDGTITNELRLYNNNQQQFNYQFDHCLIKVNEDSVDYANTDRFISVILNKEVHYKHIPESEDSDKPDYYFDFSLDTLSEAKDKGQINIISEFPELEFDLTGNSRLLDIAPDLGAYERIE